MAYMSDELAVNFCTRNLFFRWWYSFKAVYEVSEGKLNFFLVRIVMSI